MQFSSLNFVLTTLYINMERLDMPGRHAFQKCCRFLEGKNHGVELAEVSHASIS